MSWSNENKSCMRIDDKSLKFAQIWYEIMTDSWPDLVICYNLVNQLSVAKPARQFGHAMQI